MKHVLFVCTENAGRSQMAEAFPDRRAPDDGEVHEAETIRACADAVLARHADAPVRSFVMTVSQREARECLREERGRLVAV